MFEELAKAFSFLQQESNEATTGLFAAVLLAILALVLVSWYMGYLKWEMPEDEVKVPVVPATTVVV
jgi:hypothetical protein